MVGQVGITRAVKIKNAQKAHDTALRFVHLFRLSEHEAHRISPTLRRLRPRLRSGRLKLDEITTETVADFAASRQSTGLQISTVNSSAD